MAIPTSPSVVVLENDVSVFAPNINSSVVGIVGFANRGPTDKATLITSQENLIRQFGRPVTEIPGQGLEGALEILEATNQLYFVRAANADAQSASAAIDVGSCPAIMFVSGYDAPTTTASSIFYRVTNETSSVNVTGTVSLASSVNYTTSNAIIQSVFDPNLLGDQDVFSYVDPDSRGIFIAGKFAGSGAVLELSGVDSMRFLKVDASGNVGTEVATSGVVASGFTGHTVKLNAYSRYPGTGYNFTTDKNGNTRGIGVEIKNVSVRDRIVINSDGVQAEAFETLELSPSSVDSFETVLTSDENNAKSEYIYVELEDGTTAYTAPNQFGEQVPSSVFTNADNATGTNASPRFVKPIAGTYNFVSGNSGYGAQESTTNPDISTNADATALIGTAAAKTGMNALDDDTLNISLALIPGITEDTVQNALITLAETSKNFLAFVSPPYALGEVQDAINWVNGKSPTTRTAAVNSSYAATYWPWVQVFNSFEGQEEWFDPTIFAARQCVFTDAVNDPWFAPAGFRRGRLTKPTDIEQKVLNQGDRDTLYSNAINPIVKDATQGIVIFGQKTTQRTPTALDRVNVRRLMIYIRKVLLEIGKPFQFEPNDQFTWEQVEETINPFLDDLLARRAIVEGLVRCDSTTNTPARVDRNELWCSVTIKPTKAAETIVFEVNLTSQAASINQ